MEPRIFHDWKALYSVVSRRLQERRLVTPEQCAIIARTGHRKETYWRRHLLDLCDFAIEQMDREQIEDQETRVICEGIIEMVKQ